MGRFKFAVMAGVLAMMTACTALGLDELEGSKWVLNSINSVDVASNAAATLNFDSGSMLSGNGGCNGFSTQYSSREDGFSVGDIRSTRKMCSAERMESEREFFKLLRDTAQVSGESGQLLLITKNGERLLFKKR